MTSKDFQLVAEAIRTYPFGTGPSADGRRRALGEHFASYVDQTNPRFKRDVFIRACVATEEEQP